MTTQTNQENSYKSAAIGPILRPKDAATYLGLSLSSYYAMAQAGQVPRPIKLAPNGRASGVPLNHLESFIKQRAASENDGGRDG